MRPEPRLRRPLLISHSGEPGGSNEVLLSLIRHRPESCEPRCLFLADGPALEAAERLGVPVDLIDSGPIRHVWRSPGVLRHVLRHVRRVQPELVFAHVAKAHAYGSVAALAARLPYLWWQHDLPAPTLSGRIGARLPAAAVVCSSDFTAALQRRIDRSRVVRIHPGIELDDVPSLRPHRADSPLVVGAVGRLRRYKRYELLVRSIPHVLEVAPETRFVIAGGPTADTDYPGELEALARDLGIESSLELRGHVPGAVEFMQQLDLLAHTAELEPFGLVAAEALLHGVPVICPLDGGPAELVRHGVDGLHTAVEDPRALAGSILHLARDPLARERMGAAGAAHVRASFSARRMADDAWRLATEVALAHRRRA